MTTTSGDRDAATPTPVKDGLPRRRLLVMGLGTALGGATALVAARPSGALAGGSSLVGSTVGADAPSTRPDVVGDWFEQVVAASTATYIPGVADRVWAISWMSALSGLSGLSAKVDHRLPSRQRARFEDAAVATAVHDALVAQLPDQASRFDEALASSLAAIPEGNAKQAGIETGQAAAASVLAERQGDGLDPDSLNRPFTPPPEAPGVYRLPPGATETQGAGWPDARPFLLDRADRFRPDAPPALGSAHYRRDLEELRRLGRDVGSERTERQSDIARLAPGMQYTPALRALVRGPGHSLPWKVRLLAVYSASAVDAQIATSEAKFVHLHWRPVTAIRAADTDGDPRTDPDPHWSSYLTTPPNPEYPSAHAVLAGAAETVLAHFTGPRTPVAFTATYTRDDGRVVSLEYPRGTRWSTLTQDNVDSRVWAGVHFRFSDETGARLGRRVGDYGLRRLDELVGH